MKQWQIAGEWSFDALTSVEVPEPEPRAGEVLLRMTAMALNYRDHLLVLGGYGNKAGALPLVPLSDGVGEVVALGDGVTGLAPGDRVLPCFNQSWLHGELEDRMWDGLLGGPLDGTARQFMCVRADGVVPVPGHLSDPEAATLCCAAITAWNAIRELVPFDGQGLDGQGLDGQGTVVTQGTGGVSLFALQFAKAMGARVIATSSSPEKLDRLRALGADETLDYRALPDWGKSVLALTDGRGADLVVEVGGAATIKQSLRATRTSGSIALIGNVGGSVAELNLPLVFMFRKRLIGIATGSVADFRDMMGFVAEAEICPVLDDPVRDFADLKAALQELPNGRHFGKIALSVG